MFKMMVRPNNSHALSVFDFEKLDEALAAAELALKQGFYRSPKMAIVIGDGTLISVMSDEEANKAARDGQETSRTGGLVQGARQDVQENDYVVHFQIGQQSLPPLTYSEEASAQLAIDKALAAGLLRYTFKPDHDYFFVKIGSGMMLFCVSGEEYLRQRREAVALMQRAQMSQAAQSPNKRIILTGA